MKEKISREIRVLIQPSLFEKLQDKCNDKYKTISEVVRELIAEYVGGNNADSK